MAITRPVKNQIAFWEKINDLGNVTGSITINIEVSTTHKMTLSDNVVLSLSDITYIPDDSIVSLSILFTGNGTYTVTFPSNCKTTSGADLGAIIPNTKLALQLFTIDKGISWKVGPFAMDF